MREYYFDELDSTNDYSKTLEGETLVVAKTQKKGRGRADHSFFSPKGGLYFSYSFDTDKPPKDFDGLTQRTGLVLKEILSALSGEETELVGINDIYFKGKKIAGILVEYYPKEKKNRLIIGIGINLTTPKEAFQKEDLLTAGSIGDLDQKAILEQVTATLSKELK